MTFQEFLDGHAGKKTAVCGVGVSNLPLIRLLRGAGCELEARDRKPASELSCRAELEALGVPLICGEDYLDGINADIVYRSPGIHPDTPGLREAVKNGARLTSEMEAFFEVCPCHIIAVTGSDGKTTTSTLIAKILEADGKTVRLGGNIGTPLLDRVPEMNPDDFAVVELSSFQLMTMRRSAPVAVVTNVAPNHLDIHASMDEYVDAKRNVFRWQETNGRVVLNLDNDITRTYSGEARGEVLFFSRREQPENGAYFDGETVFAVRQGRSEPVMRASDIRIPGLHNVENYMAALCALDGTVSYDAVRRVATEFGGVEHRIEFVRELDGVKYYNDSIASSPTRTIAGLRSFSEKVVLIAGGYDKHIPFEPLALELGAHVKALVLFGATAGLIRAAAESQPDCPPLCEAHTLDEAVSLARTAAGEHGVVLFSPACASFDMFKNFAERGNAFKQVVLALR